MIRPALIRSSLMLPSLADPLWLGLAHPLARLTRAGERKRGTTTSVRDFEHLGSTRPRWLWRISCRRLARTMSGISR